MKQGHDLAQNLEKISLESEVILDNISEELARHRLELLSWMVATGALHIKFALRKKGMYHEKIGVMYDEVGDFVVFHGSGNESASALLPDLNFESFSIFPSWRPELIDEYGSHYMKSFDRL